VVSGTRFRHGSAEWIAPDRSRRSVRTAVVGAVCCATLSLGLAFYGLGTRPLLDAEALYASIGQAMFRSGDWVQPRLNTVRDYEKPPLFYWAIAVSHKLFGSGEFASRLPGAVAYLGTIAAASLLALVLSDAQAAVLTGTIIATSVGCFYFGRMVLPDLTLTFFLGLALLGLAMITRQHRPPWPQILFYIGAAGAGLTKGLEGLFIPFASATLYTLTVGGWRTVRQLRPGLGAGIVLGLFLPWHIAIALRDPTFVPFYVLNEHVYRFLNVRDPIDYVPLSVPAFWAATAFWLLPWVLFLPPAVVWAWRQRPRFALPLIWAAVVVGLFTLTQSRMEKYGLPALPALAVVIGAYWNSLGDPGRRSAAQLAPTVLILALALIMAVVAFVLPRDFNWIAGLVSGLDGHYREHPEDAALFLQQATALAGPFSLFMFLFGTSMLWSAWTRRVRLSFVLWVGCSATLLLFVDHASRFLAPHRSMRAVAAIIERNWQPDAMVVVAGDYEHAMSLGYYVPHPLAIVDGRSSDLAFGFRHGDAPQLVLSTAQLREMWNSWQRVFLVVDRSPIPQGATVLLERPTYALVTNRPL
jgi:dolichyl-phosphate-mannose-protein mannosyltransferase